MNNTKLDNIDIKVGGNMPVVVTSLKLYFGDYRYKLYTYVLIKKRAN